MIVAPVKVDTNDIRRMEFDEVLTEPLDVLRDRLRVSGGYFMFPNKIILGDNVVFEPLQIYFFDNDDSTVIKCNLLKNDSDRFFVGPWENFFITQVKNNDPHLMYFTRRKEQLFTYFNKSTKVFNNFSSNLPGVISMPKISTTIDTNKQALISATKLEVGNLALEALTTQALKALPEPLKSIIKDNPLLKIAVANLAHVAIQSMEINDDKVVIIDEAMMTASYLEFIKHFDFKSMISNVIDTIPEDKLNVLAK